MNARFYSWLVLSLLLVGIGSSGLVLAEDANDSPELTEVVEVTEAQEAVPQPESSHAEYFRHFDADGNGLLEGDELIVLPRMLSQDLDLDRGHPDNLLKGKVTSEKFDEALESLRKQMLQAKKLGEEERRFKAYRSQLVREATQETSEQIAMNANEQPVAEAVEEVTEEKPAEVGSGRVEVLLLRRKSEKLPHQAFSEEVLHVAGKAGPALATRLLPWLADEKNSNVQLMDYFLITTSDDAPVMVQFSGREPSAQVGSRGGSEYINVGTIVKLSSKTMEDGRTTVAIHFEKSIAEPVTGNEEKAKESSQDTAATDKPSARPNAAANTENDRERERAAMLEAIQRARGGFGGRSDPRAAQGSLPEISSMTISGTLTLRPGEPALLSESGQLERGIYEETIILVEVKP
ncbi:hypothetical protein DTL42_05565 [Bremerella cremea]|uniref:EF-hand domain-containing protein n=1 Tax=Bremerella cremea TaxID=1031537 RepID=A0A368KWA5_9BACT|nr:hypothetical protein [Bremerella cremea]RCS54601.1 hypothetical protein DTL42_05565 [Bremerella cremea]